MSGSPLQNAQQTAPALVNGELMISGGDNRRLSRGGPVGDSAGGKGVSPNLLSRVGLTRAILSQFVDRSVVGTMTVPDRPMDNADDVAALAYEYLRKQPQENFMAVILDGQGRPIQILRHTLGGISSTNFVPHLIAGVAASTRGARTVYMVHNHPSTTTRFSAADVLAAQSLSKTIEAIGMRFGGSLVVTDGDAHEGNMTPKYIFHAGGDLVEHTPAASSDNPEGDKQTDPRAVHPVVVFDDRPGSETTAEISVVERNFEVRKDALFPRIKDAKDAVEQIPPLLTSKPGIALIDKSGRLVGVIQMSISEMRNVSSAGSMIYPEQGQGRGYISSEDDREGPPGVDKRVYKRTQFSKDTPAGAWNNPLAMLMAALERSNAESVIISIGSEEFGTSGKDIRSDAVRNIQKAIMRTGGNKVEILDVINNNKNFPSQMLSSGMYGNYPSPYASAEQQKGGLLKTGRRLGFNEEGAPYGEQGQEGDQAPIEQPPKSLGDVVSQGIEGEAVSETNPEDPNAGAEFARQEREAGARVNPPGITTPSGLDNAQPAEPVIKKTRKPRAPKATGVNVSAFPRLDATPGAFGRLSGDQMKQFGLSDAMLDQFVEHSTYGQIASGVQSVKTPDDAAHVLAGMRKRPQEQIVLLITDKTGKPIQVAVHSLGGPASAGFNPGIIIGTAASTPGAANVWFVHNHPSGKSSLSPADISAGGSVENLCKAAGLRYMATMAIAGSKYAVMDNNGSISANLPTPAHARKYTIPLTERMFSYRVTQNGPAYSDPLVVGQELRKIFGDTQPGIVLADNSNRPVAAIPLDGDVMQAMRAILPGNNPTKQTGFAKYAAGVDRAGGVNMFIYTADLPMPLAVKIIENMSKVANATKVTALDAMNSSEVSLARHIVGYGTDFKEPGSSYNRGENTQENAAEGGNEAPGSIREIVEQGLSEPQKKKTKR
jgi:DNA repair protein RadC